MTVICSAPCDVSRSKIYKTMSAEAQERGEVNKGNDRERCALVTKMLEAIEEGDLAETRALWEQAKAIEANVYPEGLKPFCNADLRELVTQVVSKLNLKGLECGAKRWLDIAAEVTSEKYWMCSRMQSERLRLKAATLTNIACLKRKAGRLHSAAKYLQKAQNVEQQSNHGNVSPETMLSFGSLLSDVGRYNEGAAYCKNAVKYLKKLKQSGDKHDPRNTYLLASAWFNLGVAQAGIEGVAKVHTNASYISFKNAKHHAGLLPELPQYEHLKSLLPPLMNHPRAASPGKKPVVKKHSKLPHRSPLTAKLPRIG